MSHARSRHTTSRLLTRSVEGYDTYTKMAPPLRSDEHLEAVIEGIKDGTIDAIASVPRSGIPRRRKASRGMDKDRFGIIGLETPSNWFLQPAFVQLRIVVHMYPDIEDWCDCRTKASPCRRLRGGPTTC